MGSLGGGGGGLGGGFGWPGGGSWLRFCSPLNRWRVRPPVALPLVAGLLVAAAGTRVGSSSGPVRAMLTPTRPIVSARRIQAPPPPMLGMASSLLSLLSHRVTSLLALDPLLPSPALRVTVRGISSPNVNSLLFASFVLLTVTSLWIAKIVLNLLSSSNLVWACLVAPSSPWMVMLACLLVLPPSPMRLSFLCSPRSFLLTTS